MTVWIRRAYATTDPRTHAGAWHVLSPVIRGRAVCGARVDSKARYQRSESDLPSGASCLICLRKTGHSVEADRELQRRERRGS